MSQTVPLHTTDSAKPEVNLSSDERVAALCDLSYRAGLKAGWNYCADGDQTGFERSMESTREAVAVLNEHRLKGAPTEPAVQRPTLDVACNQSRESVMVVLEQDPDGTPSVWCDPEVADLVSALNKAGIRTVASCSGHGHRPGNIVLSDGRELVIARDFDEARKIDAIFPGINGEPPMVEHSDDVADQDRSRRNEVAVALGLMNNGDFSWSFLLQKIRECAKASGHEHALPFRLQR